MAAAAKITAKRTAAPKKPTKFDCRIRTVNGNFYTDGAPKTVYNAIKAGKEVLAKSDGSSHGTARKRIFNPALVVDVSERDSN